LEVDPTTRPHCWRPAPTCSEYVAYFYHNDPSVSNTPRSALPLQFLITADKYTI